MRKEGSQFTCERCGKTVFFDERDFPQGITINNSIGTLGWDMVRGEDFCDECMDIFNKWFRDFVEMKDSVTVTIDICK